MAKDDVGIFNLTLSRIGVTQKIAKLTDRTNEAIELNQVFEEVRDRVLAAAPWPFARKFVTLQRTGSTPLKWAYRYEYPNNCVAIRSILPPIPAGLRPEAFRRWLQENRVPYEISLDDDDSQTICTDLDGAIAEITVRVTNPARFDSYFTSAFAWALASEVALPLAKTVDHAKNAATMYSNVVNEATAKALNEEVREDPPDSEFVRARW